MKLFSAILAIYLALLCATDLVQTSSVLKRSVVNDPTLAKLQDIERILGVPCPLGWVRFNGYCYLVNSSIQTWQNAQMYCKELGGNLVKINSKEENEFVLNLVNKLAPLLKQIWIGLEWDSRLKAFVWYDHSVPTFTKWAPNEPNGNGVEPCSNMWTGHEGSFTRASGDWND
ncbi:unnamed protein product, partial [Porites evermanni]